MFINSKTAYTFKVKVTYADGKEKIYRDVIAVSRNEDNYLLHLKKSWWEENIEDLTTKKPNKVEIII